MSEIPAERSRLARFAALRMLFGRTPSPPGYESLESSAGEQAAEAPVPPSGGERCACFREMSAARRTFCLVVAFDLILSFILWGIFVKTRSNKTLVANFLDEVVYYSIKTSLFDTFICGLARFSALTPAYAIYRLRNPFVIAVTTFVTCVFVIVKVFAFQSSKFGSNPMCYIIFVEQFLIAWVETWLLDFKVLPFEREQVEPTERTSLLIPRPDHDSPFHTPEEGSVPPSPPIEPTASYEEQQLRRAALAVWERSRALIAQRDGWKPQSAGSSKGSRGTEASGSEVVVHSREVEKLGKVLRVEARIDASPLEVFEITTLQLQTSPTWNKTVTDCQVLQVVDESTDITYNVTAPAGAGVVQSRDFVAVRHWRRVSDTGALLSAACAVVHTRKPPDQRYVRGENRLSALLYGSEPGRPDACRLTMLLSTDIKGWIPQVVVDQALAGVMVDFIGCLRKHAGAVGAGRGGYQGSEGCGGGPAALGGSLIV